MQKVEPSLLADPHLGQFIVLLRPLRDPGYRYGHGGGCGGGAGAGPPRSSGWRVHRVVDWVADYMANVESFPVLSQVAPGDIRAQFPARPPEQPESLQDVLDDLDRIIMPGITHWQSPNFFAYFPANTSGPAALGELVSAGLNVQGMLWATSPACTELETHVLDWMVDLLGLPDRFRSGGPGGGVIPGQRVQRGPVRSSVAARERPAAAANRRGCDGTLVAYASNEAHSSVEKAVRIAGLGATTCASSTSTAPSPWTPAALEAAIVADQAAGRRPCFGRHDGRHHLVERAGSPCRRSPTSANGSACGCTSTGPRRAGGRLSGVPLRPRWAWRRPTATASTPTSGC